MSILTIIWTILLIYALFKKVEWIATLTLVSTIFQSAVYLRVGNLDISYLMISTIFLCIKLVQQGTKIHVRNWMIFLLLFFGWAWMVGIIAPYFFPNVEAMHLSGTSYVMSRLSEIGFPYVKYMNVLIIIICMILLSQLNLNRNKLVKLFFAINIFVDVIAIIHYLSITLGISSIFNILANSIYNSSSAELYSSYSSTYYSFTVGNRPRAIGTFLEPSYFGAYLASAIWAEVYLFLLKEDRNKDKTAFALLQLANVFILILNMSSTGIVTFVLGGIIFFMFVSGKRKLIILFLGIISTAFLLINGKWFSGLALFQNINTMIFKKVGTYSASIRTQWTTQAWHVFIKTLGLGAGIQRTRASTFVITLLVQSGLIGTVFYIKAYVNLLKENYKNRNNQFNAICFFYAIVLLVAQLVSCPQLDFAPFALALFFLAIGYEKCAVQ